MAILQVGRGLQYSTIGAAINASQDGDDIQVQAGTYTGVENMGEIKHSITLEAVGGRVTLTPDLNSADPNVYNSKGMFLIDGTGGTTSNITIKGFDFKDAVSNYSSNAAGIRFQGEEKSINLTLDNDGFFNNYEGILASGDSNDTITITNSEFSGNGYSSQEHNIYIGNIAKFTLKDSYIHGTRSTGAGNEVKSRAANTDIEGNRIYDDNSTSSWEIDLPNGGNAVIKNNIVDQGKNSGNPNMISYGTEGMVYTSNSLIASNNTFINDLAPNDNGSPNGTLLVNYNNNVSPQFSNNSLYGLTQGQLEAFDDKTKATFTGNTFLTTRPTLDTTSPLTNSATGGTVDTGGTGGGTTGSGGTGDTGITVSIGLVSDTGSSSSDRITSNPAVKGTGQANTLVTINEGGTTLGTTTADSAGAWSFTPTRLADGPHTLVASETDVAGNTGTAALNFTLDTTAPTLSMALVSDTGSSSTDRITSNPAVKGNGDPNTLVTIKEGRTTLGTTMADITGAWSFTPTRLAKGPHTLVASETDVAGNTGTAALNFILDRVPLSYVLNGVA